MVQMSDSNVDSERRYGYNSLIDITLTGNTQAFSKLLASTYYRALQVVPECQPQEEM
jgi:hypothetical protein